MARKKVVSLDCDRMVEFTEKGQFCEGYYLGSKPITTKLGPSTVHVFRGEGGNFGAYGSYMLDDLLRNVPVGFMTYVTYGGKVNIPNSGKTKHVYDVDFDDAIRDDSIVGAKVELNVGGSAEESPDVDDSVLNSSEEADPEENPLKVTPGGAKKNLGQISPNQQSNVKNLLSQTKR